MYGSCARAKVNLVSELRVSTFMFFERQAKNNTVVHHRDGSHSSVIVVIIMIMVMLIAIRTTM